jgi:hypothetical protein
MSESRGRKPRPSSEDNESKVGRTFSTAPNGRDQINSSCSRPTDPALLEFQIRCELAVALVRRGELHLTTAADDLQRHAELRGLIDQYSQDQIQQLMGRVFATLRSRR